METTLKVWWQRLYVPGNNHIHSKIVTIGGKRWDMDFNTCLHYWIIWKTTLFELYAVE